MPWCECGGQRIVWDLGLSYDTGSRDRTLVLRIGSKRPYCWVISTSSMAAVFIYQRDSSADILFRACIHALKCTFLSIHCSCFSFPLCCRLNLLGRMYPRLVSIQTHYGSYGRVTLTFWHPLIPPPPPHPRSSPRWKLQTWITKPSLLSTMEYHPGLIHARQALSQLSYIHRLKQDLANLPRRVLNL